MAPKSVGYALLDPSPRISAGSVASRAIGPTTAEMVASEQGEEVAQEIGAVDRHRPDSEEEIEVEIGVETEGIVEIEGIEGIAVAVEAGLEKRVAQKNSVKEDASSATKKGTLRETVLTTVEVEAVVWNVVAETTATETTTDVPRREADRPQEKTTDVTAEKDLQWSKDAFHLRVDNTMIRDRQQEKPASGTAVNGSKAANEELYADRRRKLRRQI